MIAALSLALATAPLATGEAMAIEAPMTIAGGDLDPAFPGADIYLGTPRSATPPPGKACALAARYVELINAGKYAETAALYADDATFLEPMRPTLRGRKAIAEFYIQRIGAMKPQIIAVSYLGNDTECMVALSTKMEIGGQPRWALVSIDHFIVRDDGKIASMVAFARPPRNP